LAIQVFTNRNVAGSDVEEHGFSRALRIPQMQRL